MKTLLRYSAILLSVLFLGIGCSSNSDPDPTPEPKPDPDPQPPVENYDISLTPKQVMGAYLPQDEYNPCSNFGIVLSDVEMGGNAYEPVFDGASEILLLDLYINAETNVLPEGIYTFTTSESMVDSSFSIFSWYGKSDSTGEVAEMVEFTEGQINVSHTTEGSYEIELIAKLSDERTIYAKYAGAIDFEELGGGDVDIFKPLDTDVQATFIESKLVYYGPTTSGAGHFMLRLHDYDTQAAAYPAAANTLTINLFSEIQNDQRVLAPGTYTVAEAYDEPKTYKAGEVQPGYADMQTFVDRGTRLVQIRNVDDNLSEVYGFVKSGTIKVEQSGKQYTVTVDLVDENDYKIKGQYVGTLETVDWSYHSTLKDDYKVNLDNMPCDVEYFGQYYADRGLMADSWNIYIGYWENGAWRDGTEAIQIEVLTPHGKFSDGLPSGEYPVTSTYDPNGNKYICLPGEYDAGNLYCSWYVGGIEYGQASLIAPFTSGTLTISNLSDKYTFKFETLDDAPVPHTLSGSWTGIPTLYDKTSGSSAAKQSARIKRSTIAKDTSVAAPHSSLSKFNKVRKHR